MATNLIIKLGLEEQAGRLAADPTMNPGKIATELSRISGRKISRGSVLRYLQANSDPVQKAVKAREEIVTRAVNERLDTVAQLRTINDKAMKIATQTDDPKIALLALREIREQLALQAKLLGDLPPDGAVTINILQNPVFVEFQAIVEEVMCPACRDRLRARLREVARP
jgi:hypothetical protein